MLPQKIANALQSGSHVSRSQWTHLVTTAALFRLQNQAYTAYKVASEAEKSEVKSFDYWFADMEVYYPQSLYWSKPLKLEILFFQIMRAQREGNFLMYIETLGSIIP